MALTPVHELQALIRDKIAAHPLAVESETVPVAAAVGRVLAQDIVSAVNLPPADISAMDGYALQSASDAGSEWAVAGESVAGLAFSGCLLEGACVRIMTGAVVPDDCNTVIVQENVQFENGRIRIEKDVAAGANIRRKGEEVAAGDTVLTAGRILREADIMLLAALGLGEVPVHRKIRVALLSSGNELLEPGEPNNGRADQIYDSNRAMLAARLSQLPVEIIDFKQVDDDLEDVLHVFDEAVRAADVLLTTGGVSVGD